MCQELSPTKVTGEQSARCVCVCELVSICVSSWGKFVFMCVTIIISFYKEWSVYGEHQLYQANTACVCPPLKFVFLHIKEKALHQFVKPF